MDYFGLLLPTRNENPLVIMEASLLDKGGGSSYIAYAQKLATQEEPRKLLDRNVIIVKIT